LGDVFFSLVNYARFLGVNPDDALASTNMRFRKRFEQMEVLAKEQKLTLSDLNNDAWEALWVAAKKIVG
jgi:XTP/dITP diphosphohydrolase